MPQQARRYWVLFHEPGRVNAGQAHREETRIQPCQSPMTARAIRLAFPLLAATTVAGTVQAQDTPTFAKPSPSAPQDAKSDPWELSVTPYLWAISLHGSIGLGKTDADVDVSFNDLLKDLNGAVMLDLELRRGRFGLMSDTVYADLGDDSSSTGDRIKVKATANQLIQGLAATYRMGTWQLADFGEAGPLSVTVDPYAGVRYTYLDTQLDGKLDLPDLGVSAQRTAEGDKQWVDPIIGLRTSWNLGQRWSLVLAGDVGGTSTNSDYSAQAFGLIGYRFGLFGDNNANLLAGYRVLHQKYEDGNGRNAFDWDITMHGPVLGLSISF